MPINKNKIKYLIVDGKNAKLDHYYLRKFIGKFKKVTASRFSNIISYKLNCPYTSEFKSWLEIVGIWSEPPAPVFNNVGNYIEPIVRESACKHFNINWQAWNNKDIRWDAFKDNKIFGGIPDGEPVDEKGVIDYSTNLPILEIKTMSVDTLAYEDDGNSLTMKLDEMGFPQILEREAKYKSLIVNNTINIPLAYKLQLGLYMYLRNTDNGIFAITLLEVEDYKHPEYYSTDERKIYYVWQFIDRKYFKTLIEYVEDWYMKYVKNGIAPPLTDDDLKWLDRETKKTMWNIEDDQ